MDKKRARTDDGLDEHIEMFFDGGARSNPGLAGAGAAIWLVSGEKRQLLWEGWEFVGENETNNVAEYRGVIIGLEALLDDRVSKTMPIQVFGDSKLIINQVSCVWRANNPHLIALRDEAKGMLDNLRQQTTVSLQHVLRARNATADGLANRAQDRMESGCEWHDGVEQPAKVETEAEQVEKWRKLFSFVSERERLALFQKYL